MADRPACYPELPAAARPREHAVAAAPRLDVLTVPVPPGLFDTPFDRRHVLCLHQGGAVPVSYREGRHERRGVRLQGQYCVSPANASTRWTMSGPATSLLLRMAPELIDETAQAMGSGGGAVELAPAAHLRDAQIERIGWMMQAEDRERYPSGRLFVDALADALAARLLALHRFARAPAATARALPGWRLARVIDYIEAHLEADLSLAELAAVAGFSVSHFKPLFKRATGLPAHRFVLQRRVERARQRVLDGAAGLSEIALDTGFADASHMARCMRRLLGVSPLQLRQARG
ncbi:AraC family transcriptional regulator [Lysobacter sp. yr284]|uniref:helix-turn-helix domain-containing protein n=1 Tax=Lysobacter sp. yr284 TaxID=1761791 RepID=UPI00089D4F22|nr:AraC family transcriptional regulator [Lysobacter sp. yr284]SDY23976.1 AraC family transcriptional regulator [Lysobacter sp. yr284]